VQSLLREWEARCSQSPALRFVDIGLRGFGQVMFQDNPLTGLLFLAAIAWGSIVAGVPHALRAGVLGVVASTLTAIWLKADKAALMAGLYGYNGVLVGLALATFLAQGPRSGSMSRWARRSRPWRHLGRRARLGRK
jgi:urea transporter